MDSPFCPHNEEKSTRKSAAWDLVSLQQNKRSFQAAALYINIYLYIFIYKALIKMIFKIVSSQLFYQFSFRVCGHFTRHINCPSQLSPTVTKEKKHNLN